MAGVKRVPPKPDVVDAQGALWSASYKSDSTAILALFDPTAPQFFFEKIEVNPDRKWWCPWRPAYVRTGDVWQGSDMREQGFRAIPHRGVVG